MILRVLALLGVMFLFSANAAQAAEVFASPVAGGRISSHYGHRDPPATAGGGQGSHDHKGADFVKDGVSNPAILATASGRVTYAGNAGGCGNMIVIDHGNGVGSRYCHLANNSMTVRTGSVVKQGQKIGTMGSTGNSSGPHLHFEIGQHSGNPTASTLKNQVNPATRIGKPVNGGSFGTASNPPLKPTSAKGSTVLARTSGGSTAVACTAENQQAILRNASVQAGIELPPIVDNVLTPQSPPIAQTQCIGQVLNSQAGNIGAIMQNTGILSGVLGGTLSGILGPVLSNPGGPNGQTQCQSQQDTIADKLKRWAVPGLVGAAVGGVTAGLIVKKKAEDAGEKARAEGAARTQAAIAQAVAQVKAQAAAQQAAGGGTTTGGGGGTTDGTGTVVVPKDSPSLPNDPANDNGVPAGSSTPSLILVPKTVRR